MTQVSSSEASVQAKPVQQGAAQPQAGSHGFPDSSMTLIEFGDEGLSILLAMRTDRDPANRRLVLTKVAYVRLEPKNWGFMAYPEAWIQQDAEGVFDAIEAKSGKLFRYPSRRRYEVAFLSKELFECAIQCLKDRRITSLYELIAVTFGARPGFSIEAGCLLAPDDYASEKQELSDDVWVPLPPLTPPAAGGGKG